MAKKQERRGSKACLATRLNHEMSKEAQTRGNARGRIAFDYIMGNARENARLEARRRTSKGHKPLRLLKLCTGHNSERLADLDTLSILDSFYRNTKVVEVEREERDCAIRALRLEVWKEKIRLKKIRERLEQQKKFEGKAKIVIGAQQRALETMDAEMNKRRETDN